METLKSSNRLTSMQWAKEMEEAGLISSRRNKMREYHHVFAANEMVSWLNRIGRCLNRGEATQLGEKLRQRDFFHHILDQHKFNDSALLFRFRCHESPGDAPPGPAVAQLLSQSRYMLAGWFLKQGAVFLNRRYFVLDRLSRRLYVFTSDISPSARYFIDLAETYYAIERVVDDASGGRVPPSPRQRTTRRSRTMGDVLPPRPTASSPSGGGLLRGFGGDNTSPPGGRPSSTDRRSHAVARRADGSTQLYTYRHPDSGSSSSDTDTDTEAPPHSRGGPADDSSFGISIRASHVHVLAYASTRKQQQVWIKALRHAVAGRMPQRKLSHSQLRLHGLDAATSSALTSPSTYDPYMLTTPSQFPRGASSPSPSLPTGRRASPAGGVGAAPGAIRMRASFSMGQAAPPPEGYVSVGEWLAPTGLSALYGDVIEDYLTALGDWTRLASLSASDLDDMGVFVPGHRRTILNLAPPTQEDGTLSPMRPPPGAALPPPGSPLFNASLYPSPTSMPSSPVATWAEDGVELSPRRRAATRGNEPAMVATISLPPRARFDIQRARVMLQIASCFAEYLGGSADARPLPTLALLPKSVGDGKRVVWQREESPARPGAPADPAACVDDDFASCLSPFRRGSGRQAGLTKLLDADVGCDWSHLYVGASPAAYAGGAVDASLCRAWAHALLHERCTCDDAIADQARRSNATVVAGSGGRPSRQAPVDSESEDEDAVAQARTLACMFKQHLVRVLKLGTHPLSVLCQRLCCSVQSLYGPLSVHRYTLRPDKALQYALADIKSTLSRLQMMLRDLPQSWCAALNDWGSTMAYVGPPEDLTVSSTVPSAVETAGDAAVPAAATPARSPPSGGGTGASTSEAVSPPVAPATGGDAHVSPRSPTVSRRAAMPRSMSEADIPRHRRWYNSAAGPKAPLASPPAVARLSSVVRVGPPKVPPTPQVRRLWAAMTTVASGVDLEEQPVEDMCAEALRRTVFSVIGDTLLGMYKPLYQDQDVALARAQATLFGITCAQLKVEGAIDAAPTLGPGDPVSPKASRFWHPFAGALNTFAAISTCKSPDDKRDALVSTVRALFNTVKEHHDRAREESGKAGRRASITISADNMLGYFSFLVINARVPHLFAQMAYLSEFMVETDMIALPGWYLTTAQAAMEYAISVEPTSLLSCGFCEAPHPTTVCQTCMRHLCDACDVRIHGSLTPLAVGDGIDSLPLGQHVRLRHQDAPASPPAAAV